MFGWILRKRKAKHIPEETGNGTKDEREFGTISGKCDGNELFSSDRFIESLNKKSPNPQRCIFCGSDNYGSLERMATLFVKDGLSSMIINQTIPCGVVICEECGHVNLFALGALGLLPKEDPDVRLD